MQTQGERQHGEVTRRGPGADTGEAARGSDKAETSAHLQSQFQAPAELERPCVCECA